MASNSAFGPQTDATDALAAFPNAVKGKNILITGVSPNGLGAALAHALAPHHPNLLILTGRTAPKVEAVANSIRETCPAVQIHTVLFDMSFFASIAQAAAEINGVVEDIDILFNNAGIMNVPERKLSVDGFEMHLATNYLGLALFTCLLLPKIKRSECGRIVSTVSNGYALSPFRFSDYNFDGGKEIPEDEQPSKEMCAAFGVPWGLGYIPPIAYAQSKTAAMLFTRALADRLADSNVTVNCVQPGVIATDLWREMDKETVQSILGSLPTKTPSQGVSTLLVAALDPKLADHSGAYLDDCQISEVLNFGQDKGMAERLWKLTEDLVARKFEI